VNQFVYVAKVYAYYFTVIFLALVLFYVGFDFMQKAPTLPESANLQILFLFNQTMFAMDLLYPIALIFALVAAKLVLIKSNALIAFYALGYSKKAVLKPFLMIALLITVFFFLLNLTPFAYSGHHARNIAHHGVTATANSDLFFKYNVEKNGQTTRYYIYFGTLFPLQKHAKNIRIFKVQDEDMLEVMNADSAYYHDGKWSVYSVHILQKEQNLELFSKGITISDMAELTILDGFKPQILDQVYEQQSSFTILDAIDAIFLFKGQGVSVDKMLGPLYQKTILPLFSPLVIIILFFIFPVSARSSNLTFYAFGAILVALTLWGMLFAFAKMTATSSIAPEVGIGIPVFILAVVAIYIWIKKL
jgi:lipopolysaccharide export system permease protein